MKTVFEKQTRDELIARIRSLDADSQPQWGKMTAYQMLKHCRLWEEMVLGIRTYKRQFLGYLFGRLALRATMGPAPLQHNLPTIPAFRITGSGDPEEEKAKWIALIETHGQSPNNGFIHPFMGKMTGEQIGYFSYKHADHHLRQFNS